MCNEEPASRSHITWLVSFLALRNISLCWVSAEPRVSGCFASSSHHQHNRRWANIPLAVPRAMLSGFGGKFQQASLGIVFLAHSLPALPCPCFFWVLQTHGEASTNCRCEVEVTPLMWNRWLSYAGVLYHTPRCVFAVSTCILGLLLREEEERNIENIVCLFPNLYISLLYRDSCRNEVYLQLIVWGQQKRSFSRAQCCCPLEFRLS